MAVVCSIKNCKAEKHKPWLYTASAWQAHIDVYEPAIFDEISPSQYAGLSNRAKREFDKRRSAQWKASHQAKMNWHLLIAEAYEKGEINKDTPGITDEAKSAIYWYKEEKTKQEELEKQKQKDLQLKIEKYKKAQELKKSDYAKWWVKNSPRQIEGFDHVNRQEANNYWRAVHDQISSTIAKYMLQEVEEAKMYVHTDHSL